MLDLDALAAQELDAGSSMFSATPIPKDAGVQHPREGDGGAHSPDEVLSSLCRSIDTAHAANRGDSCGCWPHTPRADFHQPLCAAHARSAFDWQGNAACHLAGEQSLDLRSGLASRASLLEEKRSQREELWALERAQWQEQTPWCARDQEKVDAPVPGPCRVVHPLARPHLVRVAFEPSLASRMLCEKGGWEATREQSNTGASPLRPGGTMRGCGPATVERRAGGCLAGRTF